METILPFPDDVQAEVYFCVGEGDHRIKDTKVLGVLRVLGVLGVFGVLGVIEGVGPFGFAQDKLLGVGLLIKSIITISSGIERTA